MPVRSFVMAVLFACLLPVLGAQGKIITLVTLEWPPYIGSDLQNGNPVLPGYGYAATILSEAFKKSGYSAAIDFRPWERALLEVKDGLYDGIFPLYYSAERANNLAFSDPFPGGPIVFMKLPGKTIPYKSLKDLVGYRIGIVAGYVNSLEFDKADYLEKDPAVDDEMNIRKLIAGRVDMIVIDRFVAEYFINAKYPALKGKAEFLSPVLEEKKLYAAFSRTIPGFEKKLSAFNAGLATLKGEGGVDAALRKAGISGLK